MTPDLTAERDLLFELLDDPGWRERVVEELVFGAGMYVRVTSTLQFGLSPDLIERYAGNDDDELAYVRLLLPVTTREKRPLLNFAVQGPAGGALLLPRGLLAQLQAAYLERLIQEAGHPAAFGPQTEQVLEAICVHTPALFSSFLEQTGGHRLAALARYLTSGLSTDERRVEINVTDVEHWDTWTDRTVDPLVSRLAEPLSLTSSSEQILLALPELLERPQTRDDVEALVRDYCVGVTRLAASGADRALEALALFGRRWPVILEVEVPVGQRFKVRIGEDRPLNAQPGGLRQQQSRQRWAVNDASSAHLEARVTDPNVELDTAVVRDLYENSYGLGVLEAARATPEAISLYTSAELRPALLDVDVPLRVAPGVLATPLVFAAVALAATGVAITLPADRELATSSRCWRSPSPSPQQSLSSASRAPSRRACRPGRGSW